MDATDRWSTPRLAVFIAAITGAPDEASAMRRAVDWATEALEAEIGVILEGVAVVASVGFPRGDVPAEGIVAAVHAGTEVLDVQGLGLCRLAWAPIEIESAGHLVVARGGSEAFSREEVGL